MIKALTGHRPDRMPFEVFETQVKANVVKTFDNITMLYTGMAFGFDIYAAELAFKYGVPYIAVLPFRNFRNNNKTYERVLNRAEKVIIVSEKYSKQAYFLRDKYMVDVSHQLIAAFDGGAKVGGTWITIDYAMRIGKPIEYVWRNITNE